MQKITNRDIAGLLKGNQHYKVGFIDKLKILYRPYVCPFPPILNLIEPNSKILDVGCGSGQFLLMLATYCKPNELAGIEISERLVYNAQELLKDQKSVPLEISTFDGMTFPEHINKFDYISVIDIVHHIRYKNQYPFLSNLARNMKRGSYLILKDINQSNPLFIGNKFHDMLFSREWSYEISFSKAKSILQDLEFEIIHTQKITTLWFPHYLIKAQKK